MESYIADWLNLLFRWLHLIAGAAWIGTSFYFNWLNHSVREPEDPIKGVNGQLYSVHGGHFYQILKYKGAPEKLPKTLHWFYWEAYFTWITGFCLLCVIYYWNANIYLIDSAVMALEPWQAISISVISLGAGWIIYDLLCKSPLTKKPVQFASLGFILFVGAAYGYAHVFGARASYIHVGALIGTIMAANVFFVIIPNQRIMVETMKKGEEPDVSLGAAGALRSLHNNYFTLPVLFIMISNHYSMTYGHAFNWVILAALALIGAGTRHYFNLKHQGHKSVWILPTAALAMVALAFVSKPNSKIHISNSATPSVKFAEVQEIISLRCLTCHAEKPTFTGIVSAPLGVKYDTPQQIKEMSAKMMSMAVDAQTMPPANITEMTEEERKKLGTWIAEGSNID